jgi:hypothetical protein
MSFSSAAEIATDVAAGRRSAGDVIASALDRIARHNPRLNAFTAVTADRARAAALDGGQGPGRSRCAVWCADPGDDGRRSAENSGACIARRYCAFSTASTQSSPRRLRASRR